MTSDEAKNWIREFLNRVDSQDNRMNAKPILFLLQERREYVAHPEYNHQTETFWHHHSMEGRQAKSHEEAEEMLIAYGYDKEEHAGEFELIEEFQMGHYWETKQAFFTEEGLKRHIDLNGHNIRNHRDYVVHAFRNPEMRELFEALRTIAGEP